MTDGFLENGFIIDLSNAKDTSEIIDELGEILEMPAARGKKICLKLGKIELSQAQLLSIKSLIESLGSELAFIDSKSDKTKDAAKESSVEISELSNEIEVQEIDEYDEDDEYYDDEEEIESNDKDSYELLTNKPLKQDNLPEIEEVEEEEITEEENSENSDDEDDDDEIEMSEDECKAELKKLTTLYLTQNLRSGQTMSYDGNIVLIGDTNPGSEIIARGDITVWGVMGGIAHAGARGNKFAKIRALKLNAIQLRISGYYARRPDTVNIPYIQRSSQFVPEEASVDDGNIIIRKMNEI